MTTVELDTTRVEAFSERLLGLLNESHLALAISIGHQTGLFDTMATLSPSTSDEIASAARLHERYVREVLGALVTGRIVTYDGETRRYALPAEHAALLTRAAGVDNLGALTQFVAVLGAVEQDIVRCCREGGGVPYSSFPTFQRMFGELTRDTVDATLLGSTLDLVPSLRARLEEGIDAADVGCGSGYAVNVLARAFPRSRFVGYDMSEEAIAVARAQATEWGLENARFEIADVSGLDKREAFDLVTTFDAVHDQRDPGRVLQNISQSLRPGGTYLCVDIAASSHLEENLEHPLAPMLYTISAMHCMTVSLAQDGAGLGAMWGEQTATAMLQAAGFSEVVAEHVESDPFNVYYVATRG